MRILQICNRVPYPPLDGGSLAMHQLSMSLSENATVNVFALNTEKHHVGNDELPNWYLEKFNFKAVTINTRINIWLLFLNFFKNGSYNVERFHDSEVTDELIKILKAKKFEVIQLESIFTAPYIETIRKYSRAKIILRAHNIESEIWKRNSAKQRSPLKKWYFKFLAGRLEKYEISVSNEVDSIISISKENESQFINWGFNKPMMNIPFGVELKQFDNNNVNKLIEFYHLGSMDWMPNEEGIRWFLKNVWVKITESHNCIRLSIAGKNMPPDLFNSSYRYLKVTGLIRDASGFISDKNVLIVPLFSGSGMRVKIIEAMAAGKTVISTSLGAEGINYTRNKDIIIADTGNEFIEEITRLILQPDLMRSIGKNAMELVSREYDYIALGKKLNKFYHNLVK